LQEALTKQKEELELKVIEAVNFSNVNFEKHTHERETLQLNFDSQILHLRDETNGNLQREGTRLTELIKA
jgi:hypothetical protein